MATAKQYCWPSFFSLFWFICEQCSNTDEQNCVSIQNFHQYLLLYLPRLLFVHENKPYTVYWGNLEVTNHCILKIFTFSMIFKTNQLSCVFDFGYKTRLFWTICDYWLIILNYVHPLLKIAYGWQLFTDGVFGVLAKFIGRLVLVTSYKSSQNNYDFFCITILNKIIKCCIDIENETKKR